jgi:hypothetical protein
MAGSTKKEEAVNWPLERETLNELILKPVFVSDNIFTGTFRVMKNVKDEAKMFFLGAPSKFLQNNDNCDFTPKGGLELVPDKIRVCRKKINMKQCKDEVFDTCLEAALTGAGDAIFDPGATPEDSALQKAMSAQIAKGLTNDLFLLSSFATPGSDLSDGFYDNCYPGLFVDIAAKVASGRLTQINAGSGTALVPGAAIAIFEGLWAARSLAFKGFQKFIAMHEIHCTDDIAENLRQYYQALGVLQQYELIRDGIATLYWNGIPVVSHPEWDAELRNPAVFNLTEPHRAILTIAGNMTVATDLSGSDVSLRVYMDVHETNIFTQGYLRFGGAKVAFPELMVYGQ